MYKRDPANGMLVGPDDCHYANEHQINHFALLKMCGCGVPEDAYNFCRKILECYDARDTARWLGNGGEVAVKKIIIDDPETAAHVMSHFFTHLKLLEHGGSVGGSWLTDAGKRIVDMPPATAELMDAEE